MTKTIDYYYSLVSPWTYLGSARLEQIAARHSAAIRPYPIDLGAIFPLTGGLPLAKRAPARQNYRLVELARWRDFLGMPLNIHPAYFPANETQAAACAIATRIDRGDAAALKLSHAILRAVWVEEKNIADPQTLRGIIDATGQDGAVLLERATRPDVAEARRNDTETALARGVFGAPSFIYRDELFWGQDRLDFLDRALARA